MLLSMFLNDVILGLESIVQSDQSNQHHVNQDHNQQQLPVNQHQQQKISLPAGTGTGMDVDQEVGVADWLDSLLPNGQIRTEPNGNFKLLESDPILAANSNSAAGSGLFLGDDSEMRNFWDDS